MKKILLIIVLALIVLVDPVFSFVFDDVSFDLLTNEKIISIGIFAEDNEIAAIMMRSTGDMFELFLMASEVYFDTDDISILIRFDDRAIMDYTAHASTNGKGCFFDIADSLVTIARMKMYDRMVVRVFDYEGTAHTFAFDTSGFRVFYDKYF